MDLLSIDPANGESVGSVPVASDEQVRAAVARARAAAPAWAALGPGRRALLVDAYAALATQRDALSTLVNREMGKPLREAQGEVAYAVDGADEAYDEIAAALAPEVHERGGTRSTVHYEPMGVCAAITPWNFPILMPHSLVFPALAAGNTVVLKPSEETPLCAQAYVEGLNTVLPPGVLQIVHGADAPGRALVAADVDLIAFTGSRAAGKHILGAASAGLKRVVLELGGKDPLLVLDDADPEEAAAFAAKNAFRNAGQVCVSTERIYVGEALGERFEKALAERAASFVPGERMGPMVSATQKAHVVSQVSEAIADGARLVAGDLEGEGNFLSAIVLADVTHDMRIMREETFGPVACVARVKDDEEALRLANDTPYGLGAVVYGGDLERAEAVACRVQAGMVGVNRSCGGVGGTPWVGAKQSGYGYHGGVGGHRQFAQPRVVSVTRG